MAKNKLPRPTDGELAILRVLWESGPSTVRDVFSVLNRTSETGYTTVLKLLQIMTDKGLVTRDDSQRTHIFSPALKEADAQRQFVGQLLDRLFKGSATSLVLQALAGKKASPAELAEIRKLLDDMERRSK